MVAAPRRYPQPQPTELANSLFGLVAPPRFEVDDEGDGVEAGAPVDEPSGPSGPSGPPVAAPAPGAVVGGYRVGQVIGRKRSGVLTQALDLEGGRMVVVHWIWRELIEGPLGARLIEEAELASAAADEGIAAPSAIVREDGFVGIVRPYVAGLSLRERLAGARARLTVREAIALGRQVASALARIQAMGLVHGDLRPETVVLSDASSRSATEKAAGRAVDAVVLAFGCTVAGHEPAAARGSGDAPPYAPPERSGAPPGAPIDARADVHALGGLIYEALVGRPALGASPPRLRAIRPEVPQWLDALVADCLATDPDDRPPDAEAVLAELQAAPVAHRPGPEVRAARAARSVGSALALAVFAPAAVALSLLILAGGGLVALVVLVSALRLLG